MQPGMPARQRAEGRPVRDIAGGEQQGAFLAVQVGQLALELDVVVVGARDVAGAAGAGAAAVQRLVHGGDHRGVLAHAEIVVGAPDGDLLLLGPVVGGAGEAPGLALEIGEDAVAAFGPQRVEFGLEEAFIVHRGHSGEDLKSPSQIPTSSVQRH